MSADREFGIDLYDGNSIRDWKPLVAWEKQIKFCYFRIGIGARAEDLTLLRQAAVETPWALGGYYEVWLPTLPKDYMKASLTRVLNEVGHTFQLPVSLVFEPQAEWDRRKGRYIRGWPSWGDLKYLATAVANLGYLVNVCTNLAGLNEIRAQAPSQELSEVDWWIERYYAWPRWGEEMNIPDTLRLLDLNYGIPPERIQFMQTVGDHGSYPPGASYDHGADYDRAVAWEFAYNPDPEPTPEPIPVPEPTPEPEPSPEGLLEATVTHIVKDPRTGAPLTDYVSYHVLTLPKNDWELVPDSRLSKIYPTTYLLRNGLDWAFNGGAGWTVSPKGILSIYGLSLYRGQGFGALDGNWEQVWIDREGNCSLLRPSSKWITFPFTNRLVMNGQVTQINKAVDYRARLAFGWRLNGDYIIFWNDGGDYSANHGFSFQEVAQLMKDLGCITAVMQDGGGSVCGARRENDAAQVVGIPAGEDPVKIGETIYRMRATAGHLGVRRRTA